MSLYELPYQIDIGWISNLQQHDRQIAGNGVAPQAGLAAAVLDENAGIGAQRGIGINDGAGQPAVELCVGLGGVELPQDHLVMGPRQIENAIRQTLVLIFFDQALACVAAGADAGDNVDGCRLFRIERDLRPDGDNRIEHGALAARERRATAQGLRIGDGVSSPDEPHAVRLIGDSTGIRPVDRHQVKHPWSLLVAGAGPAGAEDRLAVADDLGLNKKVAEGRVQGVGSR